MGAFGASLGLQAKFNHALIVGAKYAGHHFIDEIKIIEFTAASLVTALPLRSSLTPAVLVAPWLDRGLALAGLLACLLTLRQPRHRHSAPSEVR